MYSLFVTFVCAHLARIRSWIVTFLSVAKFMKLEHFVIRFFLSFNWIRMQPFNSFLQTSFSRPPNCLIDFNRTHGSARFLVKERGKMLGVLVAIDPHATAAGGGPSTWCSRPFPASSTATGLHRARPPRPWTSLISRPAARGDRRNGPRGRPLRAGRSGRVDRCQASYQLPLGSSPRPTSSSPLPSPPWCSIHPCSYHGISCL